MSYEFTAPIKDPAAVLDHGMDWSDWLDEGEMIAGQPTVVPEPAGLTISAITQADGVVNWRVSGGTLGQDYIVTCRIQTSLGRADERSVRYRVRDR
jgi:hypothetical protein